MTRTTSLLALLLLGASAAAVVGWRKVTQLQMENESLRAQVDAQQEQTATAAATATAQNDRELENLRSQTTELLRLRNEVTQLRTGAKDVEKLRADNQRLRSENQRSVAGGTAANAPALATNQFARDNWSFSGYATPDAALVSAIWAMKEGNPKTYLESLAPEEQARMSKVWENKSEAEIAAKHQSDVAAISGMQILDRKAISNDEIQMNIYIEGVDRLEKVSMKQVDGQWKFGGFIRDAKK